MSDERKNLLVICPSRGRPERLEQMIDSFEKTINKDKTSLAVYFDEDDPCFDRYIDITVGRVIPGWGERKSFTEIVNDALKHFPDCDYYSLTNDDMIYKTAGWDEILMQDKGISFGNAGRGNFPITSVIDGDLVRALGWINLPELQHLCGDNVWYWIGKRLKKLYYHPEVRIVHNHPYLSDQDWDETYDETNSSQRYAIDYAEYKDWLKYRITDDLKKIEDYFQRRQDESIRHCIKS